MSELPEEAGDAPLIPRLTNFVRQTASAGTAFWLDGQGQASDVPLQDHADIIYSCYLLGCGVALKPKAAEAFEQYISGLALHGRPAGDPPPCGKPVNAHLTAYLLGAVRLLDQLGKAGPPAALYEGWRVEELIDHRHVPRWPKVWSHHIWRVSHWIGGVPSIMLHLAASGCVAEVDHTLVARVLDACETHVIEPDTGLLRPYRSRLVQESFRLLYRLRHDPDVSDVAGVVHLLWVHHATGRPYVAPGALNAMAARHLQRTPFMENVPYCLDFDIVQLARTTSAVNPEALRVRAGTFAKDLIAFLSGSALEEYALHKLPGALATLHETAFLRGEATTAGLGIGRIDIIQDAYWL